MSHRVGIIGSYLSPYVRKVLAVLHLKGIEYEVDPIVPFLGGDRFSAVSPVRRVPVLLDGDVTLCDSTVICEYLDERYQSPRVFPDDPVRRARARWIEEYADTRMGEVIIWRLYNQIVINPFVWHAPTDTAVVQRAIEVEMPDVLTYLEGQLPAEGFLFGEEVTVADLAVAAFFRNAKFARYTLDAARWPRTAGFVDRTLALDCLARLRPFEDKSFRTPIAHHREALAALGAPIMKDTYGVDAPRRGVMNI